MGRSDFGTGTDLGWRGLCFDHQGGAANLSFQRNPSCLHGNHVYGRDLVAPRQKIPPINMIPMKAGRVSLKRKVCSTSLIIKAKPTPTKVSRSEEHTSELQSL